MKTNHKSIEDRQQEITNFRAKVLVAVFLFTVLGMLTQFVLIVLIAIKELR